MGGMLTFKKDLAPDSRLFSTESSIVHVVYSEIFYSVEKDIHVFSRCAFQTKVDDKPPYTRLLQSHSAIMRIGVKTAETSGA